MTEYIDIYDKNRRLVRTRQERGVKLREGEFIVVVGIWVINDKNEILLTKRHPDKSYAPNLWENTGGHMQSGENSIDAVLRELLEETGIAAEKENVEFIGSICIPPFFGDNYFVRKNAPLSEVKLQPGETSDMRYVTYEDFRRMADSGELAPSVVNHLKPIQAQFLSKLFQKI